MARSSRGVFIVLSLVVLYLAATAVRVYARQYYIFLPHYFRTAIPQPPESAHNAAGPTHIFFLFVDHFEPDWSLERTEQWAGRYRALARRHLDSSGRPTQHTWFFPGDQ